VSSEGAGDAGPNIFEQQARGQISFDQIRQGAMISLLKNADLSTFIHESGHLYLEILIRHVVAQNATCPPTSRATPTRSCAGSA
jgi:hypothetical protein